jgi:hypothetical protein
MGLGRVQEVCLVAEAPAVLIEVLNCVSPIVFSCLLAGSCSNATSRRDTQ